MLSALLLTTLAYTELDTFLASRRELPVPGPLDAVTQRLVAGGRVSHVEPRLGVPTFFWAERQPSPPDLRAVGLTPEEAARRALFTYAPLYRADPVALAEAPLKHVHDRGTGAVVVQFEHREGGVPVFHERLNVVLTQRLELVGLSGARAPFPWLRRDFKLAAETALAVAFEALSPEPVRFHAEGLDAAGAQRFSAPTLSMARAQQVLFPDPDAGELLSAWYVELETANDLLGTVVSALDGRVLWRRSLTAADSYGYRVWADPATKRPLDGPNGRATPHPTGAPDGTRFPFVAPALITLEHAGLSTNDPWLGPGATETTGNNAEAYADLVDPDGFNTGDVRGGVSAPGVFGDTFDPTTAPDTATQRKAGLAQLFYTVNWLHDWFYDSGFDESAGNAQTLNYGRGGFEGDSIKAEGQDRGGFNNANMSTPADGARPRMQMYLWTPASLSRVSASSIPLDVSAAAAAFGPATFDLSMQAVLANDATAPTSDGCQALTTNVAGKIAVLDRGTCTFKVKALNAQNAGAVGVLLINSTSPMLNTLADDTAVTTAITIPTQMVTQADGATLRTALGAATVTVRMTRASPPNRDGSVDNTVVAHEWGHYLSNRLVPGLGTQQARGLGEGWGDFVALLLTTEEADAQVAANANFGGAYALAVWDMDSPLVTTNATYFGIRRAPYSVDFTKNGLTFRHIATDEPLPMMPTSITAADNAEVHNTGEVWAAMLWEGYVALLRATPRLTFSQAQQRMQRYLVAGLKLTPGEPTFTEARDGVLAAAAAEDLADYRLLAEAFARRGLGIKAVSPPRTAATNSPLTADFTTGNDVAFVSATLDDEAFYCDRDGLLDVGERGRLRVTLKNVGFAALSGVTATVSTTLAGVTVTPSTLTFGAFDSFTTATAEAVVTLPPQLNAITALPLTVSFTDPSLAVAGPRTASVSFAVQKDSAPNALASDDVEADLTPWRFPTTQGRWAWQRTTVDALNHRFVGVDAPGTSDASLESPPLQVGTGPFSFQFQNRWSFEYSQNKAWDGAVLELTTDDGATWIDIGNQAVPTYGGTLDTTSGNPLAGRQAYVNKSVGYPAFVTTTVNLGTTYARQLIRIRLRVGADQNTGDVGWEVDEFRFTGLTSTPFPVAVVDRALCINRPPVANAGSDLVVDERTQVTLSAAASTDVDGDLLTAAWTQVAGPTVAVVNGVFTAPEVTADQSLRFSLVVNDGTVDSLAADEVEVLVRQVNRAPAVDAGVELQVDERATFEVVASALDDDGDALTYAWRQVSGPTTVVSGADTATLSGVAPEVTVNTPVVFELSVTDGQATSTDTVTLEVREVNRAPTVRAFADAMVASGAKVTLTAVAMDADGDAVRLTWSQTAGPTVTLSSTESDVPDFTAPTTYADLTLTFSVVATDGRDQSAPATVSVVVRGDNRAPVAVAGNVTVESGEVVQLDGSASSDADGDALSFAWTQASGTALTFSGADAATPTVTAPVVKSEESMVVVLAVRDARGAVGSTEVTVTVTPKKASGCGCAGVSGMEPMVMLFGVLVLLRRRR